MKCNNEKPKCRNCLDHSKSCQYVELAKRPRLDSSVLNLPQAHLLWRPSIARISQLEQENQRLHQSLSALKEQTQTVEIVDDNASITTTIAESRSTASQRYTRFNVSASCRSRSTYLQALQPQTPIPLSNGASIGQKIFSPDTESCYHGPTSTVFDEDSRKTALGQNISSTAKNPEITKCQLIAETARQRQLEMVNMLAGKLDFDGVDPELGMHLLAIYWNRQLLPGPIVYRTIFMRDMACSGPYFSKLLLNAIYFHACKYSPRLEVRQDPNNCLTAGFKYRQRAVELLSQSFDKSDITTIQALLIMSSSIFSWCDEKSVSWLYARMAFNMIIDLGIHVVPSSLKRTFSDEEVELRRRVFWASYGEFFLSSSHNLTWC